MRIFAADSGCIEGAAQHVSLRRTVSCRRNLVIQVVDGTTGAFLGNYGSFGSGPATCNSDEVAIGFAGFDSTVGLTFLSHDTKRLSTIAWTVAVFNDSNGSASVTAYIMCKKRAL